MPKKIFIIEDEENIRGLIKFALESYKYDVEDFETAEDALDRMRVKKPDLMIFDIMLPRMDGISAVKFIRKIPEFSVMPIMLLTAKDSELDKVTGFDCGADDYMTKPFSILELSARVRALLRRSSIVDSSLKPYVINYGRLSINTGTRQVLVKNELVELTYKEYELLLYLVNAAPNTVARNELIQKIWGYDYIGESRTLDIHISSLRQKLGVMGMCIKTVRSVGYRFQYEEDNNVKGIEDA